MATIIMNDQPMEGKVGERLLNVARRNAAHIGFICDNAGTCQGCRCQVLDGAAHLSPPNEAEQAWIAPERLAQGERLACQAIIESHGEIRVLSRAEQLRRLVMAVITPRPGESRRAPLRPLAKSLAQAGVDQLAGFPKNVITSIARVGPLRFAFPVVDRKRLLSDAARVAQRLRTAPALPAIRRSQPIPLLQAGSDEAPDPARD